MLEEFYPKLHLKKSGQGPGGKFNGPSIKNILKDEFLKLLEELLQLAAPPAQPQSLTRAVIELVQIFF